jgi:dTMP kinase
MAEKEILKFISIEGGDGAGKSTYIPKLKEYLESLGQEVVLTREPGGTDLSEKIRSLVCDLQMSVVTETLLLEAGRYEHVEQVIRPALKQGKWVICDRFADSTFAYQCAGKGFPEAHLRQLEAIVHKDINPSLTFFFDVPLNVSKERLLKTGKQLDKFEIASDDFKNSVRMGYKSLVKKNPERYRLVDSSKSIEDTTEQVMGFFKDFVEDVLSDNSLKKRFKM